MHVKIMSEVKMYFLRKQSVPFVKSFINYVYECMIYERIDANEI